jgi:hypothetical protein
MADITPSPSFPRNAGREIGKSGTLIQQGQIHGEEYNAALRGHALIKKVEVMRRSNSTVHAALLVVTLPILGADWHIDPATDGEGNISDVDQEIADFVNRELFKRNLNFFNFTREALTALPFGYSVFEKMYEPTDFNGKLRIGIKKLGIS